MKFTFLIPAICLILLAACQPLVTNSETGDFLLNESEVPAGLPLPTIDWEFDGSKFSDKATLVENYSTLFNQRFVVYGFTISVTKAASKADLDIFFKGRSGANDEWIVRWKVDGNAGVKEFIYVPGTEQDLVDAGKLKVRVK